VIIRVDGTLRQTQIRIHGRQARQADFIVSLELL
jgi:hypothetical protein